MAFSPKDQERQALHRFLEALHYDHKQHQLTLAARKEAEIAQANAYWKAKEAEAEGETSVLVVQPKAALESNSFFQEWLDNIQQRLNTRAAEVVAQLLSLLAKKVESGEMSQRTADILGKAVEAVFQPSVTLAQQQAFFDSRTLTEMAPSAPLLSVDDHLALAALPERISSRAHTTLRSRPRPSAPVFTPEDMPAMVHNKSVLRAMQLVNNVFNSGVPAEEVEQILEQTVAFLKAEAYEKLVDNYIAPFTDASNQYQNRCGYTECATKHGFMPNMAEAAEAFSTPDDSMKHHTWRTQPSAATYEDEDNVKDCKFGF